MSGRPLLHFYRMLIMLSLVVIRLNMNINNVGFNPYPVPYIIIVQ